MIYELNPSQFETIAPLLTGERINLEIRAIVEGYNPGWVFVDNVMHPKTAMVWSKGIQGFYFLGQVDSPTFNESLNTYIKYIIGPRAKKMNMDSFEFSGTSDAWDETLSRIFKERNLHISKQYVYKRPADARPVSVERPLDSAFVVRKVDQDLLADKTLDLGLVKDNVQEWWGSVGDFSKHGMGYCVLHDNQAVCACLTSFYDGKRIETKQDFRQKGLATQVVSAFVQDGIKKDLELYWDCMEKNEGSRALAEKLGYEKAYEYTLYEFAF